MHYVTNKYTLKKDAVVSIEMFVPIDQPTKLSYALSPPQAYRQEAGQTEHRTYCRETECFSALGNIQRVLYRMISVVGSFRSLNAPQARVQ
jgi:hypothetical protein